MIRRTVCPIAPRCTGTCGAFATSDPSPRKTAQVLCESYSSPHDLIPALGDYGRGTALQVAEILHEAGIDLAANEFAPAFGRAAPFVKEAVGNYLRTVSK